MLKALDKHRTLDLVAVVAMLGGMALMVVSLLQADVRMAIAAAALLLPALAYGMR